MSIEIVDENTSVRKGLTHKTLKALGIGQKRAKVKRQPIKVLSNGFYITNRCYDCGVRGGNKSGLCSSCGSFHLKKAAVIKFHFEEVNSYCDPFFVLSYYSQKKTLDICRKEDVSLTLDAYQDLGYDISLVERYRGK